MGKKKSSKNSPRLGMVGDRASPSSSIPVPRDGSPDPSTTLVETSPATKSRIPSPSKGSPSIPKPVPGKDATFTVAYTVQSTVVAATVVTSSVANSPQIPAAVVLPEAEPAATKAVPAAEPAAETAKEAPQPDLPTNSWCDLVKGSSKRPQKKGKPFLLDSGEPCVAIPNSVIEKNKKSWDLFILGQFYSDPPSQGAVHAIANGIWSKQLRDITVSRLEGNAFLFRVPNAQTRARILNQGLWQIEGQTMFVAKWQPGPTPAKPELTSAPVWLEFRKVPHQFFSLEGLELIASMVGTPIMLHPTTANMTNLEVAKVLTVIDPRKPLPEGVNVKFESGAISRILVSSPWMPPICSHCKGIGHSIKRCNVAPITCTVCKSTAHPTESCPRMKSTSSTLPIKRVQVIPPTSLPSSISKDKGHLEVPSQQENITTPPAVLVAGQGNASTSSSGAQSTPKQQKASMHLATPRELPPDPGQALTSRKAYSGSSSSSDSPSESEQEEVIPPIDNSYIKAYRRRQTRSTQGKGPYKF